MFRIQLRTRNNDQPFCAGWVGFIYEDKSLEFQRLCGGSE